MARSIAAKLNVLESVIVRGEDSVEDARWGQAEEVVRLLDAGNTQREVATDWINGRTNKPYTQSHVRDCKAIWLRFGECFNTQDCPDWTTAYYTVQKGSGELIPAEQRRQEWSEAHEARAPKSKAAAHRLAQNIVAQGDDRIMEAIHDELSVAMVDRAQARHAEGSAEPSVRGLMGDDDFNPAESWADTLILRVVNNMHALNAHVRKWGLVLGSMTEQDAYEYLFAIEQSAAEHRVTVQERLADRERSAT